jgi:hypothetical protein
MLVYNRKLGVGNIAKAQMFIDRMGVLMTVTLADDEEFKKLFSEEFHIRKQDKRNQGHLVYCITRI